VRAADTDTDSTTFDYNASQLEYWMSWSDNNRTLTCTPPAGTIGQKFYVAFWVTTPTGGTDSFVGIIHVAATLGPERSEWSVPEPAAAGPNPTQGAFTIEAPLAPGGIGHFTVVDISGRRVAELRFDSGRRMEWNGRDHSGRLVAPGLYLYQVAVGAHRRTGRIVVAR